MREYWVILRSVSAAHLQENGTILIKAASASTIPVREVVLHSEYTAGGPRFLRCDIRGMADSVDDAIVMYGNLAGEHLNLLSFLANAAVGQPNVAVIYEVTPGADKRAYRQRILAQTPVHPVMFRTIPTRWFGVVQEAINAHPKSERLRRSISYYAEALRSWHPHDMIRPGEFLFQAVEALSPVIVAAEMATLGTKTKQDLAQYYGFSPKDESDRSHLYDLEGKLRCLRIFGEREDIYQGLRKLSDGFEHAYLPFDEIRSLSKQVSQMASEAIRRTILVQAGVSSDVLVELHAPSVTMPLAGWAPVVEIEGVWGGNLDEVPAKAIPVECHAEVQIGGRVEEGKMERKFETKLNIARIGDLPNIEFGITGTSIALPGSGKLAISRWESGDVTPISPNVKPEPEDSS